MSILVCVDTTEASSKVIELAAHYAERLDAKLWLLQVAEPDPDFVGYEVGPQHIRDAKAAQFHAAHKAVQSRSAELRERGIDATALLVQGGVADTILAEAERLAVSLIVLGSHGKGLAKRALLGSTSEAVLHHAAVPVLIVPMRAVKQQP